jgi:hypothetical protein
MTNFAELGWLGSAAIALACPVLIVLARKIGLKLHDDSGSLATKSDYCTRRSASSSRAISCEASSQDVGVQAERAAAPAWIPNWPSGSQFETCCQKTTHADCQIEGPGRRVPAGGPSRLYITLIPEGREPEHSLESISPVVRIVHQFAGRPRHANPGADGDSAVFPVEEMGVNQRG